MKRPRPVEGFVAERSRKRTIWYVVLFVLGTAFGTFATIAGIKGILGIPGGDTKSWYALAGVGIVFTCVASGYTQIRALRKRQRVVIARDRLQILESEGVIDFVVAQVPFHNVRDTKKRRVDFGYDYVLELHDAGDKDMLWGPAGSPFAYVVMNEFKLPTGFRTSTPELFDRIKFAIKRLREKAESKRDDD